MRGKERLVARLGALTGLTRLLESLRGRPSLLVLNYHRIGDAAGTALDPGVFSCTAKDFERQVALLRRRGLLVGLERALDIAAGRTHPQGPSVLLTFDDGYRDNYDVAFPILRAHDASAAFFLTTGLVGGFDAPWWDAAAHIVRGCPARSLALEYPERVTFDLSTPARRAAAVEGAQALCKRAPAWDPERFLAELERACGVRRPDRAERLFLSWDEAREMKAGGMAFGSHTRSHPILARLPFEAQLEELRESRRALERELGEPPRCLAYPDGQPGTFDDATRRAAKEAGYEAAFSYVPGAVTPGARPYDLPRYSDDSVDFHTWRLRVALRSAGRA